MTAQFSHIYVVSPLKEPATGVIAFLAQMSESNGPWVSLVFVLNYNFVIKYVCIP